MSSIHRGTALVMRQVPAGQHAPVVGASMIAARRHQRPPAALPPTIAPEPEPSRTSAFHGREHNCRELLVLGVPRDGPDRVLLLSAQRLRPRKVLFVYQSQCHYRDRLPCASRIRAFLSSCRPDAVRSTSVREEPRRHVTDVILPAEEHSEVPNRLSRLVYVEPMDWPSDGEMPHAGQDVVMALARMRSGEDALRGRADLQHPCPGVIERALQALAEPEVAAEEMIEYQPEVAFGLDRELKMEDHARGACRQPSRPAARLMPFASTNSPLRRRDSSSRSAAVSSFSASVR